MKNFVGETVTIAFGNEKRQSAHIVLTSNQIELASLNATETNYVNKELAKDAKQLCIVLNQYHRQVFILKNGFDKGAKRNEIYRVLGDKAAQNLGDNKEIDFVGFDDTEALYCVAEGLVLGSYAYTKHGADSKQRTPLNLLMDAHCSEDIAFSNLVILCDAVFIARDLVNTPYNFLNATDFANKAREIGKDSGFLVEVFEKERIKALKMGGLLAVNQGSVQPPTFTVMEYKPDNAHNEQPYILVGKGVTFDTGGLNIKTPWTHMREMKCDMAGAAAVLLAISAVAKAKLPIYVVALVPATDNQTDSTAVLPGDVITISNGKTVEVLNTDAEGRLILADALSYAHRYNPQLVIDLATLTGSAAMAIGAQASVCMGNASADYKSRLHAAAVRTHERLVEFPLFEDYQKNIKSDVADMANISTGAPEAGAIIAGIFLENFAGPSWMHLDIAGTAFNSSKDAYRPKNGTGIGVRLLFDFLQQEIKEHQ